MPTTKQIVLFYRETYVFLFCNTAIIAFVSALIWIIGVIRPRPDSIALHYDVFFGIDRLGPWTDLLTEAAEVAVLMLINAAIAYKIFARDKYLSYYLLCMASIAPIIFLVYLVSLTVFVLGV